MFGRITHNWRVFVTLILVLSATTSFAQSTAFTYQGKLSDNNSPASGPYDFQFKLYDTQTVGTGTQFGSLVSASNVTVTAGIFTVQLDFGACASCFNGAPRFLELAVKPTSGSTFTTLGPRQPVSSTPYAIRSLNATAADGLSVACVNCVTSSQIQSVQGSQVSGAIPVASLPGGSANYIQNTTTQQALANFNISGDGAAAGTLSGNAVNSSSQYNFAGQRLLGVTGSASFPNSNLFLGLGAGQVNAPNGSNGIRNTFAGNNAGAGNTTGFANSFFGALAGEANTSGAQNSFFGRTAGQSNQSGSDNTFFGSQAGQVNVTGSRNTYIGSAAGGSDALTNASAFGYRAFATQSNTLVLGSINGVNGATADTSVGIGTTAPSARLHVVGDGLFTGNLTVNGTMNANLSSAIINATTQYNIGGNRVLGVGGNNTNLFVGIGAGAANTTGFSNSFFGRDAGASNTSGSQNSFFGIEAGKSNTVGSDNTFFGDFSGKSNVSGLGNSFFGSAAGENTTSGFNSFFGNGAGFGNTTGTGNSFFGSNAGQNNTANDNSFFGREAGFLNTIGNLNSFFGQRAGRNNTTGSGNSFFGMEAGKSNTAGIGNAFFGDSAGKSNVTSGANSFFGSSAGANTTSGFNSFFGQATGFENTTGTRNSFFGSNAGQGNTTGNDNAYFGLEAGFSNQAGSNNAFFGLRAGRNNTANANSFFGYQAGFANTTGIQNSFFGYNAGQNNVGNINSFFGYLAGSANTSGSQNAFFGNAAGANNTTGSFNTFFGNVAGVENTTGISNSFFGISAGSVNTTGTRNTLLGGLANVGSDDLTNAAAIGYRALVSQNNSLVLGSINGINNCTAANSCDSVNVGIGTTTPQAPLHLQRDGNVGANWQNAQLRISGATDPNMQLNLGYDTTNNRGVIQAGHANVIFKDLLLNPSGGNIGIGTNSPQRTLSVAGGIVVDQGNQNTTSNNFGITFGSFSGEGIASNRGAGVNPNGLDFFSGGGGTPRLSITNGGNVGIGTTNPSFKLHVNGSVAGLGPYQDLSDRRYKRNIQPLADALDKVLRLRGVSFDWRQAEYPEMNFATGRKLGFIAQEIEQVIPEAVTKDERGVYTVAYASVTPLLVEAIKEQQKTIEQLRLENADLRERLAALEQVVKKLIEKPVRDENGATASQRRLRFAEVR